jgi:hypothetical protein
MSKANLRQPGKIEERKKWCKNHTAGTGAALRLIRTPWRARTAAGRTKVARGRARRRRRRRAGTGGATREAGNRASGYGLRRKRVVFTRGWRRRLLRPRRRCYHALTKTIRLYPTAVPKLYFGFTSKYGRVL